MFRYMQNCPIYFGPGAIDHLGEYVSELGSKKAFCVYDPGVEAAGVPARAVASLEKAGIQCVCFNKIMSDPTIGVVDEAGEIALREQVDVIIGIGGGSSMDAAKAISILMTNPGPISKYVLAKPISVDTKVPVVSVPTTAGTGSEATRVAIITQTETNGKWSVFVNTSLAVVDPEITFGLPKNVTAFTGLDALSHAAECVTSNVTNPHNQLLGCAAIRKIFDHLYTAWSEPDNVEARTEMALAANWAGIAFAETMCHVGHALADGLSINFHTPHGYNCAQALPVALEYAAPAVPKEMKMVAEAMHPAPGRRERGRAGTSLRGRGLGAHAEAGGQVPEGDGLHPGGRAEDRGGGSREPPQHLLPGPGDQRSGPQDGRKDVRQLPVIQVSNTRLAPPDPRSGGAFFGGYAPASSGVTAWTTGFPFCAVTRARPPGARLPARSRSVMGSSRRRRTFRRSGLAPKR